MREDTVLKHILLPLCGPRRKPIDDSLPFKGGLELTAQGGLLMMV